MGRIRRPIVHRDFPIAAFFPNPVRTGPPWVHSRHTARMSTSLDPSQIPDAPDCILRTGLNAYSLLPQRP
jgi:hypothetical protein